MTDRAEPRSRPPDRGAPVSSPEQFGSAASRARAVVGVAAAWVRHYDARSALSIVGVCLGVVLLISLAGIGHGTLTRAEAGIDATNRELWVTAGPVELRPGGVGGVRNPILDAHATRREIAAVRGVADAEALAFQTVYVSPDGASFDTVAAVGLTGRAAELQYVAGGPFSADDVHYANGTYAGEMTHETVVSRAIARRYSLSVGDTVHVGGTVAAARAHEFRVVGITTSLSRFVGTPTLGLHLAELQRVSGATGSDRATVVAVNVREGASVTRVRARLESALPGYTVRTTGEQARATVGRRPTLLVAGASLLVLAVVGSVAVVANSLVLLVHHQREPLAALAALGVRHGTLAAVVVAQGLLLGAIGGLAGCLAAVPLLEGLGVAVEATVGFEDLVRAPPWVFALGFAVATATGLVSSLAAAWRLLRLQPLSVLGE